MVLAISLVFAFTLISIKPLVNVLADSTYNVTITFEVTDSSEVTLQAQNGNEAVAYNQEGAELIGKRGDNSRIEFEDTADNTKITGNNVKVVCTDNKNCTATVTVPNEHGVRIVTAGGTPFGFMLGNIDYGFGNDNITQNTTLTIVNRDAGEPFDGKAYLIWSCGGGTCYHLFENIGEDPMFVASSTIKADNDASKTFDVHAEKKNICIEKRF